MAQEMAVAKPRAQNGAQVTMTNQTQFQMTLDRSENWSGVPVGAFPQTILANGGSANFTHLNGGAFGSSGAVVYSGFNVRMQMCAWILAWDAPVTSTTYKVYVACGSKGYIDTLSFDQIHSNLANSSATSNGTDSAAKVAANGAINNSNPSTAYVGSTFSLLP